MSAVATFLEAISGLDVETQPQKVRRRSRDFYWYSPVLKRELDHCQADAVVSASDEAEVVRVLREAFRHDVPVTVRGAGTGNYGQAMPLKGGIVLDLSRLNQVIGIEQGSARVQAGARMMDIDLAAHPSGQELRFHPSTHRTATIGGYVAGGSSGIGSITHGLLRDRGNIIAARIVTMEAEPRILTLHGDDIQKVNHAYGTNAVITELTVPLAPAYPWVELVAEFDDFMPAVRFADAFSGEPGILKKLVTPIAAPVPAQYLFRDQVGPDKSVMLLMVAPFAMDATRDMLAEHGGRIVKQQAYALDERSVPLFEYSWNHTTLHALKYQRDITYLQVLFPPPNHVALVEQMCARYGDEVPMHLEFVRFGNQIACFGLPLVRFTTEERLNEIIADYNASGCPIFNPHAYTLEEGGMKRVDPVQLAFKRETDPKGLLNPGKMIGWDNPAYDESVNDRALYER
ncbi:FAD-binding oxidoreductase [Geminicoccus roseus]|uniref:FAD-binding oxidoreductase n=1 Tax=Geminicoccus roseus TaxID=404900 RepID=UPI0003FEB7AD|nr:FAD-binding oxidoreductase [Geminicoccus roseus]